MNINDIFKYTYYNNLYNVHERTSLNTILYGFPYACSMICGNKPPSIPHKYSAYEWMTEQPNTYNKNCGLNELDSIDTIIASSDPKTEYKSYCTNSTSVNNKIPKNGYRYFWLSFNLYEFWNGEEALGPNWLSWCLTNRHDLNITDGYTYMYDEWGSIPIVNDYFPSAPIIGYEQETVWIATNNYVSKIKSPFTNTQIFDGQYLFDEHIYGETIYCFGNRNNNTLNIAVWSNEQLKIGKQIISPINLDQDLYLFPGIVFKDTMYSAEVDAKLEVFDEDLNDDDIKPWLESIIIN